MGAFVEMVAKIYGAPLASFLVVILGYIWFSRALDHHNTDLKLSFHGIVKDVEHLVEKVNDVEETSGECRDRRRTIEDEIHNRVTQNAQAIAKVEGRLNGGLR